MVETVHNGPETARTGQMWHKKNSQKLQKWPKAVRNSQQTKFRCYYWRHAMVSGTEEQSGTAWAQRHNPPRRLAERPVAADRARGKGRSRQQKNLPQPQPTAKLWGQHVHLELSVHQRQEFGGRRQTLRPHPGPTTNRRIGEAIPPTPPPTPPSP